MYRQREAIVYTSLSHELGNVGFHRALFDAYAAPISLFDRPPTSKSKTSFSRVVKAVRLAEKKRPGD